MLSKTSISAIRVLLLLAQRDAARCRSPRKLAEALGESPTYLAKVVRHLVKRGILEAERGAKGGVRLTTDPAQVSLLAVIEACQGDLIGGFCKSTAPEASFCNFHRAAKELHEAVRGVLNRWTLAELLKRPCAGGELRQGIPCMMGRELDGGAAAPPIRLEASR